MTTANPLLQQPEGKTLEFKRDLSSPRNVLKTLVAFANSAGGRLVIGVDDARNAVGVADPLDEEERLCNLIADGIAPRLVPSVELMSVGNATLLVAEVFPSSNRPHHLVALGPEQGVYLRLGSSNRQAGPDWIAQAHRAAAGQVFDEQPMPALSLDDLDLAAMTRLFGPDRVLDATRLQTLKLLRPDQGRLVPTQGAVLLFGKQREMHFPDAWVQCGRFRGLNKVEIFDQQEIHASLPDAVTAIELFLKKHAFKTARFGAMQREDVWSIPLTMLREAIVNALVHADYAQRGAPMRVAFFDDRIDIESPGFLLPGMTIADMQSGVSRIRNPVIARVFRELRLIEQWGSGVKRILDEAAALGLPTPQIAEIPTGVRLSILLGSSHQIGATAAHEPPLAHQSEQVSAQVDAQVLTLLKHCATQPRSKQELLAVLRLSNAYLNYKRHIVPLLEQGLLAQTIPDKPQSRLQRYRLTDRARALLGQPGAKETS
ncbi:AlbA family DNA-binding domain-containing protein [Thauera butanivorans]|uniref:AlbA family DNA-binding domain-containing protein n=1 Tax=Thauera butanivorans TaxID=86174 RepID=UPI000837B16E|nr:helix-turn-helix domain-containing protein [Thauera butanivorans]